MFESSLNTYGSRMYLRHYFFNWKRIKLLMLQQFQLQFLSIQLPAKSPLA